MKREIRTIAPSNIALVKYWGKRNTQLNLPLTSSRSVTLRQLFSEAIIEESPTNQDQWDIHGNPSKAQKVLQEAREFTQDFRPLHISIKNHFPSGAGLASSASSMAALSQGLAQFLGEKSPPFSKVAEWARKGSGSATRSLLQGFVFWDAGIHPNGEDCIVRQLFPAEHFPLSLVVCVVDDQPKPISSTAAMERCRDTSPNYQAFHQRNPDDLKQAQDAIANKDLLSLGKVAEANCLAMHEVMWQANPSINYFLPGTHQAIELTRKLRDDGLPCFFTIDAGPNVKIFCHPSHKQHVKQACQSLSGLIDILEDDLVD